MIFKFAMERRNKFCLSSFHLTKFNLVLKRPVIWTADEKIDKSFYEGAIGSTLLFRYVGLNRSYDPSEG